MSTSNSGNIIREGLIEGTIIYSGYDIKAKGEEKEASLALNKNKTKTLELLRREAENNGYKKGLEDGLQQGYEVGRAEGLDLGYKAGLLIAKNELKDSLQLLKSIAKMIQEKNADVFELVKPEIIKFSLAVCERILHSELSNPKMFAALLEKLFHQAKSIIKDVPIDVILAPEDLAALQEKMTELGYSREELQNINFSADPALEHGNCRLETSLGLLNFNIDRLLRDLEIKTLEA